jgi:hypothetical protein
MDSMEGRLLRLEGHLNALAQAWLYLAQIVEVQGGMDLIGMEYDLRGRRWPSDLGIDDDARETMAWLCDQLDAERTRRREIDARVKFVVDGKIADVGNFENVVPITRARRS